MKIIRITNIAGCIRFWEFFQQGIVETAKFMRYDLSTDTLRKILFHLAKQPNAWIGVAVADDDQPIGFAVAHECTPLFSPKREFEASIMYRIEGRADAFVELQQAFETFCRTEKIHRYYATTRRDSGTAIRCFQSSRYGFKRAYTTFIKEIK